MIRVTHQYWTRKQGWFKSALSWINYCQGSNQVRFGKKVSDRTGWRKIALPSLETRAKSLWQTCCQYWISPARHGSSKTSHQGRAEPALFKSSIIKSRYTYRFGNIWLHWDMTLAVVMVLKLCHLWGILKVKLSNIDQSDFSSCRMPHIKYCTSISSATARWNLTTFVPSSWISTLVGRAVGRYKSLVNPFVPTGRRKGGRPPDVDSWLSSHTSLSLFWPLLQCNVDAG